MYQMIKTRRFFYYIIFYHMFVHSLFLVKYGLRLKMIIFNLISIEDSMTKINFFRTSNSESNKLPELLFSCVHIFSDSFQSHQRLPKIWPVMWS